MGNKLQYRADEKININTHLKYGKIDKRLINSLGYDNDSVFYKIEIDNPNKIHLHISIDLSHSMSGTKIHECIIASTAIAQAVSMTKDISICIDFRFTHLLNNIEFPCIILAYDSKKDKMQKIITLFKYITPGGCTPEGLCYPTILKILQSVPGNNTEKYFINFSDGMPMCTDYEGSVAIKHTKKQVDLMRQAGIKIISYFIDQSYSKKVQAFQQWAKGKNPTIKTVTDFRKMYGKDAQEINVTEIVPLAKSLNNKFIE